MDIIYSDGSKDLSLQSLTMTIMIQKILEDEGMRPNCTRHHNAIALRAIEVVKNLPLPLLLKWQFRQMTLPIMHEMQSWYYNKDKACRVVLTQNGMVDLPKSIRVMLNNKNVSLMQRFKVACDHCLEQEIFNIGSQINFPHNFCTPEQRRSPLLYAHHSWSLAEIWYLIYQGNFHAKLSRNDISEDYCNEGFVQAICMGNSDGVKYFVERASPSTIIENNHGKILSIHFGISFTPDACIKMFKRLSEDERLQHKCCFSALLLKALLKWPYRHQFLKAAESLAKNMDSLCFWTVAALIVKKALRHGYEDHNYYKGLFIGFWNLGREPKVSHIPSNRYLMDLLSDVILLRDERLAHFLLDNTTEEFKTQHIFNGDRGCLQLIFRKQFEALELFTKVCSVNNDKLLVKFLQMDIPEYLNSGVPYRFHNHSSLKDFTDKEMANILREFLSRMNKLKP